jgi:ParB/RepB/Spo0J family partition protein
MRLKDVAESTKDMFMIDIEKISIPKDNCGRLEYDEDKIQEIGLSIMENGQKTPVIIRQEEGTIMLVAGSYRMKGIRWVNKFKNAGIKLVKCVAEEKVKDADGRLREPTEDERVLEQLAENVHTPYSQMEYAKLFEKLIKSGHSVGEISKSVGKTEQWVRDCLKLINLDEDLKGKVERGEIPPSTARAIQKAPKKARETAKLMTDTGHKVTKRTVEELSKREESFSIDNFIDGLINAGGFVRITEVGQEVAHRGKVTIDWKDPAKIVVLVKPI